MADDPKKTASDTQNLVNDDYDIHKDVLSYTGIGSWKVEIVDGHEPRMFCDATMERLLGVLGKKLTPEEIYHSWFDNIDKEHTAAVQDAMDRMINGQHAEIQCPWRYADGTMVVVRSGGVRDFGFQDGIRLVGVHECITELHHIELEQQRSNAAVDETLSTITKQLYGYNLTVDITDGSYTLITGTGTEEAIALARKCDNYREFYDANMRRVRSEFMDRCRELCSLDYMRNNCERLGYFGTAEFAVTGNGEERWEEVNVTFGINVMGHPIANILGRDITEAKRSVVQREKEMKAAAAKDQLLSGITQTLYGFNVTVNLLTGRYSLIKGTGTERICAVFEAYRKEDYSKAIEVIVSHVADDYKSSCRKLLGRDYLMALRDRSGFIGSDEFPWVSTEGVSRWCEVNVFIGTDDDGMPLANILGRDITGAHTRAETERQLIIAKQASAAKTNFLSTLSHDIRTPMNSILGMTTIAQTHIRQRGERGESAEDCLGKVAHCLDNVLVASHHMLSLVNDILDMSRMESGRFSMNELPFTVDEVIEHVGTIIRQQADAKGLEFNCTEQNVANRHLIGDAMRLNQIFINILGNSVKFTGSHGVIGWNIEEKPGEHEGETVLVFTCSDNGRGMSQEFIPHLFEPFAQEGRQTSDTYVGTGLGMSIVGQLVELMNGTIDVQTELGKGTTFTITLPFKIDPNLTAAEEAVMSGQDQGLELISKYRFLVVDDVPANSEVVTQMIMLAGGRTEIANDGAKGYEVFRDSQPGHFDCILMDVRMPVMNGYEATKAIRSLNRPDAKTIPIIAMTADAFADDIARAKSAGMNAHVSKPLRFKVFAETLAQIVNAQKSATPPTSTLTPNS